MYGSPLKIKFSGKIAIGYATGAVFVLQVHLLRYEPCGRVTAKLHQYAFHRFATTSAHITATV